MGTREIEIGSSALDQFPAFEADGYTKRSGLTSPDFTVSAFINGAVAALSTTISEIGSTGEYTITFTPLVSGYYELQVLIDFNKQIWHEAYQAVSELTNDLAFESRNQGNKIDLAPVSAATAVTDSLFDQLANKDVGKTFSKATDSLEAISNSLSTSGLAAALAQIQADLTRTMGLMHKNAILDMQVYDGQGQLTSARLRVFDLAANVPSTPGGSETVGLLHRYTIEAAYAGLNVVTKFTLKQVL